MRAPPTKDGIPRRGETRLEAATAARAAVTRLNTLSDEVEGEDSDDVSDDPSVPLEPSLPDPSPGPEGVPKEDDPGPDA